MPLVLSLFLNFAKIGLFTFGGGYAMIALIEDCCVEKKKWITHEDMMNVTVIAESTPGPIAINCATFVGYKQAGFLGAVASTIGVVLPSFVIIYLISMFFDRALELPVIANAFQGIKLAVGLLILNAAKNMVKKLPKNGLSISIFIVACAVMLAVNIFSLELSSIVLLLAAAVVSIAVCLIGRAAQKKGGDGV